MSLTRFMRGPELQLTRVSICCGRNSHSCRSFDAQQPRGNTIAGPVTKYEIASVL